jgi:protocatechuate 3,4-dioxygenase beta subunit
MNGSCVFLAIFTTALVWAQNTIVVTGRITDAATGSPVEDAAIVFKQDSRAASGKMQYTDAGGNYSFEEVAPGTGSVEITAQGFLPFQKTNPDDISIEISADHAEHNFKLTPAASISRRKYCRDAVPRGLHRRRQTLRSRDRRVRDPV